MKMLITGSRSYRLDHVLPAILGSYLGAEGGLIIVVGDARGADMHARHWCCFHEAEARIYEADWGKHGKPAGVIRNQTMLDKEHTPEEPIDACFAFVDKPLAESRGTADMVRRVRKAGIPTYVIEAMGVWP